MGSSDIVDFQAPAALDMEEPGECEKRKAQQPLSVLGKKKDAQAANGNGETDQVEKGSLARTRTPGERHVWTEKDPRSRKMRTTRP